MANIVEAVKNELTGDLLNKLTAAVGENVETVKTAANAATPALLSALAGLASNQLGLDKLASILEGFSADSPGALRDEVIAGRGDAIQQRGATTLDSLLGGGLSVLVDALAKFASAKPESIRRLLGYLAPMILSLVASRLKAAGGLGAANLRSFFDQQKSNITGAVPPGLSLVGLPSPLHRTAATADHGGRPYWMGSLLVVIILGLFAGYFFLQQPTPPTTEVDPTEIMTVPSAPQPVAPSEAQDKAEKAVQSAPTGPAEASDKKAEEKAAKTAAPTAAEVTRSLGEAHVIGISSLAAVNSPETAEGQLPTLTALGPKLDEIKGHWDKLSDADKQTVAKSSAENRDSFKSLADKTLQKPEIADKLKGILDMLVQKLDAFSA